MGDPNEPSFNTQGFLQENPSCQKEFEKKQKNRESTKRFKEEVRKASQGQGRQQNGGNESGYESEHVGNNGGRNPVGVAYQVDNQHGVLDAITEEFTSAFNKFQIRYNFQF